MASTTLIGYAAAGAGVLIVAFNKFLSSLPLISNFGSRATAYTLVAGIALVAVGVVLVMSGGGSSSRNVKHASAEVPIYEGEGKKRRIIGVKIRSTGAELHLTSSR